ncbi:MAG: hypothetical protein ACFE7E_04810 [Candidatus Hodarchaeota archaeon]
MGEGKPSNFPSLILATIAGILLIVSRTSGGLGFYGTILSYIAVQFGGEVALVVSYLLWALSIIASLGGFAVIIGGFLIHRGRVTTGRFIISIGAGMGIIGLLVEIGSAALQGWTSLVGLLFAMTQSLSWIGIILSIVASLLAKKN